MVDINIYWFYVLINIIIILGNVKNQDFINILPFINYYSSTDKIVNYSVKSSTLGREITFTTLTKSLDEFQIIILNINNTKSFSSSFKESLIVIYRQIDDLFCLKCIYQISISCHESRDVNQLAFMFHESFNNPDVYLSDNEIMSVSVDQMGSYYYRYHTPDITDVVSTNVYIEYLAYNSRALVDIYVSTEQYPDPNDDTTYTWWDKQTSQHSFIILSTDKNFCHNKICIYFITIIPNQEMSFSLLANVSNTYNDIKINDTIKDFVINPFSSFYTKIYIPQDDIVNYHLIIHIYYEESLLFNVINNVGIFVSNSPQINPSSSQWTCLTNNSYCFILISYNDPLFCMDCYFYIRGDGVPDNNFLMKVSLNATTSYSFLPYQINPGKIFGGFIRGTGEKIDKDYLLYIPPSTEESIIDTLEVKIKYDTFVENTPIGLITNYHDSYPNPSCPNKKMWGLYFYESGYSNYYITSHDNGFCTDANFILTLRSSTNKLLYYNIWYYYNKDLVLLNNNITKNDIINNNTLGNYYKYDSSNYELDTNYEIILYNKGNYNLFVHIAKTSFRDGDESYEWEFNVQKKQLMRFIIYNTDNNYEYGKPLYIHINHIDSNINENVPIELLVKYVEPDVILLNTLLEPTKYTYNYSRTGYNYFLMDVTHVRSLKEIMFQINSTYQSLFFLYLNVNNYPKPTKEYLYKISLTTKYTFKLTESQKDFCTGCKYYLSVYSVQKTPHVYSVFSNKVVEPVELYIDTPYNDLIEGNSYSDIYIFSIIENPQNPNIHIYIGKEIDTSNLEIAITTKNITEPNCKNIYSWCYQTYLNYNNTIILNNSNPDYCTGCIYHLAIYPIKFVNKDIHYEINVKCPDGGCIQCPTHFDPSKSCNECLYGYYGNNCEGICSCGHGQCNEGKHGDGKCKCYEGWIDPICNECKPNYFGLNCQQCEVDCHNNGRCEDGIYGSGECVCNGNYSALSMCTDCIYGYYGNQCQSMCPGIDSTMICSNNGNCSSGINGNGMCECNDGYHGIDCSTNDNTTNCKPFCNKHNGYCDELNKVCSCINGYFGPTCDDSPSRSTGMKGSTIAVIVVVVVIVVVIIISGVVWFMRHKKRSSSSSYKSVF